MQQFRSIVIRMKSALRAIVLSGIVIVLTMVGATASAQTVGQWSEEDFIVVRNPRHPSRGSGSDEAKLGEVGPVTVWVAGEEREAFDCRMGADIKIWERRCLSAAALLIKRKALTG